MGMYHKNHLIGPKSKRYAKRQTSRGMRRAVKRSCTDESITLRGKSKICMDMIRGCLAK